MPFYGRPSKNCEGCRERRIKCDRIQPVCSQCMRAGKPCGGYRDIPALLFRDETDKAARRSATAKSRAGERRKVPAAPVLKSDASSTSSEEELKAAVPQRRLILPLVPTVPIAVSTTVEDLGLKFFCTQFVTASSAAMDGPFVLSTSSFIDTVSVELSFRDAVASVGLAALSNVTRDRSLRLAAREKYALSLNAVRQAVANPLQARPNETIKIILMIGLYEMVCCNSSQLDAWTIHLDGAAALLRQGSFSKAIKTRDPRAQLQFFYFSMVKYYHAQKALPIEFSNFTINSLQSSNPDDLPAIDLVDILARFMNFHTTRGDPNFDPSNGVRTAIAFDTELEHWEEHLPHKWQFFVETSSDMKQTFYGKYMVYHDMWASRDLNYYFWGRLIVNEMMLNNIAKLARVGLLEVQHLQRRQRALGVVSQMATYICTGASTILGGFENGMPLKGQTQVPPLNGVFMLLFPLTVAGDSPAAPDEVHEWVVQKLQTIGSKMGIQRALELIPKIQRVRAWKSQLMSIEQQNI
ncbi:hypothetical protein N7466_008114 [Penicillium verhagenii]|uniref:uncharacterized protein n=1 Tax=Penicillium verhagenii TaxID=1562060 RepID=UPI002545517A|nr:uncharacterized protein N7466_008114 [Penicillium verhagenii]KAJ5923927.1 hypothetical protein N7466_008114 [Penicillium verhagenii]